MSDLTIEQLNDKITNLTGIVEKQSALIGKTGQQLVEMQIKGVKKSINDMDNKAQPAKADDIDLSDYVTNDDIVQLVGELQGQLDGLEDRVTNRILNSKLVSGKEDGKILPLTNKDGELPPSDIFPKTVKEFKLLSKDNITSLAEFYELVVVNESGLTKVLEESNAKSVEEANALLEKENKNRSSYTEDDIKVLYQDLSRYLGLIL